MIGYATLGTNDLSRAGAFYDALLADIGAKRLWEYGRGIGWGAHPQQPSLAIMLPFDGEPATVGNGVMIGLLAKTKEQVDQLYQKALSLGAQDEGPAGPRGEGFYAGYFRDLDGNKLCFFCAG